MERTIADLVTFEVIPVVRTALKETAELTGALQVLGDRVDTLTAELAEGELTEIRKLMARLVSAADRLNGGDGR